MSAVALAVALLTGLAPVDAAGTPAADVTADVQQLLEDARRAYDAVEYDGALATLEGLDGRADLPDHTRARVRAFIGLVRAQMADEPGARAAFAAALALDTCVALPDTPTTPRVLAIFDDEQRKARREAPARPTLPPPTADAAATDAPSGAAAPLVVAGALGATGALTLAGASVFGILALATHAEANAAPFQSDAIAKAGEARDHALVGNTLALVGGTLLVGAGGAAVVLLASGHAPRAASADPRE